MEVREIVNEEIKKGMRLIHKRGYKNRGWRENKAKTVTNVVMTTNGTHSHVVYDNGGFDYLFDLGDHYFEVVEDKPTDMQLFKDDIASKLVFDVAHIDESDLAIDYMKAICLVPTAGLEDSYVLFKDEVYLVKDSDDPLKYIVQLNGGRVITANKNRFEVVGREPVVLGIPTFDGITQEVEDSGAAEYLEDGDILPEANFSQPSWKEPTMISVEDLTQGEKQPTIKSIAESVHKKEIKKNKKNLATKYPHYYKSVENLDHIDVYDVLKLFDVNDPCLQHAIKKLFALGGRGHKDHDKDFKDVMDSLERYGVMRGEYAK